MSYMAALLAGVPKFLLPLLIINILGSETTAYLRIAWAISSILFITIPYAISTALFAEGSYDPSKIRVNVIRAAGFMLGLVIPGIVIVLFLGDKILWLFGTAYSENGLVALRILAVSSLPIIFIQLYLTIRVVQMRMKQVVLVDALIAVLVLGLTYALMPAYGLAGVAIGWTLSQVLVAVLIGIILLIQKQTGMRPGW